MGVDASYVMPYRKGLLKLLLRKITLGQHYMYRPGVKLIMTRDVQWETAMKDTYTTTYIILNIQRETDKWFQRYSKVIWFPFEGVLEIDDGIRYYDRDGTKDNEDYHKMVVDYYKDLFTELNHDVWNVKIHPDYGGSVGEDPQSYSSYDSEMVDGTGILEELPIEVMKDDEKKQHIALHGETAKNTCDLAQALHDGLHDKVLELLPEHDTILWLKCAVLAKNSICCDVICKRMKEPLPEDCFDIAYQNKDKNTMRVLLNNKYRPTLKQLFDCPKLGDIGFFDEVLTSFINGGMKSSNDNNEKYGVSCELLKKLYVCLH